MRGRTRVLRQKPEGTSRQAQAAGSAKDLPGLSLGSTVSKSIYMSGSIILDDTFLYYTSSIRRRCSREPMCPGSRVWTGLRRSARQRVYLVIDVEWASSTHGAHARTAAIRQPYHTFCFASGSALDRPMVLLNHIIEVATRAYFHRPQAAIFLGEQSQA